MGGVKKKKVKSNLGSVGIRIKKATSPQVTAEDVQKYMHSRPDVGNAICDGHFIQYDIQLS